MLTQIPEKISWLGKTCAVLAALIMMYMVGHILLEIVLRSFFNSSTYVLDEFIGYGVAAMTFLTLAYAVDKGSLIRVSLLHSVAPLWFRKVMDLLAVIVTFAISFGLAWYIWRSIMRNYTRERVSETIAEVPLWIPEAMVFFGLAVFMLALVGQAIRILTTDSTLSDGGSH